MSPAVTGAPTTADVVPPGSGPLVGVVVVSYGSSALVRAHLAGQVLPDGLRVVVVDNRSTADEAAALAQLCREEGFSFVALPTNGGFAAGCNAGAARAVELGCETLVMLNPDAAADPEVLLSLADEALADPSALVSPRIEDSTGTTVFAGARLSLADGRIRSNPAAALRRPQPWTTGACVALSVALHRKLGGVPEGYFLYWEDLELSHRCLAAGGRLVLRADLVVRHDEGGTHGGGARRGKSALYYRWNTRNRLVFAARNLPRRDILAWLAATPSVSREILLRGGRRQLLTAPGLAVAALRGSLEGALVATSALLGRRPGNGRRRVLVAHPGAELYGSDRVLVESVEALLAEGVDVTVTVPVDGPLVDALTARGARVVQCPVPVVRKSVLRPRGAVGALVTAVRGLVPAIRLVSRAGRDGVLVNTLTIPSWVLLARLTGRRVVCHVHEAETGAHPVLRRALALPAALATGAVLNSRFSRDALVADAPALRDRTVVVYNGVPGPPEVVPPREELTGPVHLLFVGRLSPRKGVRVALDTLVELTTRGVDARLTVLGDVFPGYEWFRDELHAAVEQAEVSDRVVWAGFRPDVWPSLAAADVVLVPSVDDEPFGNTAVEATLAARPVLVSDSSGLREAAAGHRSARLLPVGDASAWADGVTAVVADWPDARAAALEDAEDAARGFAPARYRREFAAATASWWGPA